MIKPNALRMIGEALYGPRWQTNLAADLEVTPRTIHYWLAGQLPIGDQHRDRLKLLLQRRRLAIGAIENAL